MREKRLLRRIIQYLIGLCCMAFAAVLLKRTCWGISPVTAVADAMALVLPMSLGTTTVIIHGLCVIGQMVVQRRVTIKTLLTIVVGFVFGYMVDFFAWIFNPDMLLWQKIIALAAGVAIQGLGVALVSGCDMMLPAPDELTNVISRTYNKKLSRVKIVADATYVAIALVINLISTGTLASVGIASVVSVVCTGFFVGVFYKLMPWIKMPTFFMT